MSDPFTDAEYVDRLRRAREEMAVHGLDALYVTSPANIFYLTGYESIWYPPRLPIGVVVVREPERTIFFDWIRHEDYARLHTRCDEFVFFEYHDQADPIETVGTAFRDRGLADAVVGVERSGHIPPGPIVDAMAEILAAGGAEIRSADWIVDDLRLFKSAAELERIREAAEIADAAYEQLGEQLRPGLTELQVCGLVHKLLADQGSEVAACSPLVNSGPTAWMDVHSFPTRRELVAGDTLSIDSCAVVDRYHANLCRTFSIGEPNPDAVAALDAAAGSIDELCRLARVGDGPETAAAAAERWVLDRVPAEKVWWVGGYALGIALPPHWVGNAYLANDGLTSITWQPGYVSNFENILVDKEAGFEACTIDTVVMTEEGLEVLSRHPRGLWETRT
jgi:Xaa-Pro aminopeptidase